MVYWAFLNLLPFAIKISIRIILVIVIININWVFSESSFIVIRTLVSIVSWLESKTLQILILRAILFLMSCALTSTTSVEELILSNY